jgi:hypothetical protein
LFKGWNVDSAELAQGGRQQRQTKKRLLRAEKTISTLSSRNSGQIPNVQSFEVAATQAKYLMCIPFNFSHHQDCL